MRSSILASLGRSNSQLEPQRVLRLVGLLIAGLVLPIGTAQGQVCAPEPGFSIDYLDLAASVPRADTTCANNETPFCYPAEFQSVIYETLGGCDPNGGPCSVRANVYVQFPGISQNDPIPNTPIFLDWHTSTGAVAALCGFSFAQINDDYGVTRIQAGGFSCGNPGGLEDADTYTIIARTCQGDPFGCEELVTTSVPFSGPAAAAALCEPEEPPTSECGECESCPIPGSGTNVGGGGQSSTPPGSGPQAFLRYRAGGAGHPGFPGSLGWTTELGRYWSHDYAERIVMDPDETHVWLITRFGSFREFSGLSGQFYTETSPSDEYRTLEWLGVGNGWVLHDLDGTDYSFDAGGHAGIQPSAGQPWVLSKDRNGHEITATYDSLDRLVEVQLPDGRDEVYGYHPSGKLSFIDERGVDGTTRRWSYSWTGDDLTQIDRPDGTALAFFYEDTNFPGYMTRQELIPTIGAPRVLQAWEFDASGNVVKTWKGDSSSTGPDVVELYTLIFDDPANPTQTTMTNPTGGMTVFSYDFVDGKPRIATIDGDCALCGFGPSTLFEYNDSGNPLLPTEIEDARDIDGAGTGSITLLSYDANGRLTSRTEAANDPNPPFDTRTTTIQYDTNFPALPTLVLRPSVVAGMFRETQMQYDPATGDLEWSEIRGFEEDSAGVPQPFTYRANFGYTDSQPTSSGLPTSIDPPGFGITDQTSWTYDPTRGNLFPLTRTDALDLGTATFTHDTFNRRVRTLDANGLATDTQYDALDRVRFVIQRANAASLPGDPPQAGDLATESLYNSYGDLDVLIRPAGNRTVYGYDSAGRLTSIEQRTAADERKQRTFYALDALGNRLLEELQEWNGAGWDTIADTAFTYTLGGCLLATMSHAAGEVTEYAYDCNSNLERVWDANHPSAGQTNPATQVYSYDELNRLVEIDQPWAGAGGGSATTSYAYDAQDHLSQVTDAESNVTAYTYSDRDLLTSETSIASGATSHLYNEHGELTSSTDGRAITTTRAVDAADRIALVDYPTGSDTTYAYGTDPLLFEQGRLIGITRDGETVASSYDSFGRLVTDGALTYSYDLNSNRQTIGYPGGVSASYTFDYADRQAVLSFDPGTGSQTLATGGEYLPRGPLASIDLGNGLTETRSFDSRYFPSAISVAPTGGGAALFSWDYATPSPPDGVGNILNITDTLDPGNNRTYGYQDIHYFLTQGDGPWGTLAWDYDKIGNRESEIRDGGSPADYVYDTNGTGNTPLLDLIDLTAGGEGTHDYTYGPAGHLESIDLNGNVIDFASADDGRLANALRSIDSADFAYDGRSFLRSADSSKDASLIFSDGFETGDTACWSTTTTAEAAEQGVGCVVPGSGATTQPTYDSQGLLHVVARRDDGADPFDMAYVFYLAGRPIAQYLQPGSGGAATLTYLTTDHLGTPVFASNDGGPPGVEIWSGGFEPFGDDWQTGGSGASASGIFLRFPGQWDDATWGPATLGAEQYYNVHRWLAPGTGRYGRVDPLGLDALRRVEAFDLAVGSHFLYGDSNPANRFDPLAFAWYDWIPFVAPIKCFYWGLKCNDEAKCCLADTGLTDFGRDTEELAQSFNEAGGKMSPGFITCLQALPACQKASAYCASAAQGRPTGSGRAGGKPIVKP